MSGRVGGGLIDEGNIPSIAKYIEHLGVCVLGRGISLCLTIILI